MNTQSINLVKDYKISATYPPVVVIPAAINDQMLASVAMFRSKGRVILIHTLFVNLFAGTST